MPTHGASTSPPNVSAPEGPGRTSSPSIPPVVIPTLHATGSRSWILPGRRPDSDADARSEYQSAERTGTRRAWEDFLAKYPSGRYSDLARDRLAKLDPPRQKPDSDADARSEYQSAERTGTRRAWEDFLAKYPSGRYSDLARDRLAKLVPPQRTDYDADARSEYQSAERIGTRRAWEDFLDQVSLGPLCGPRARQACESSTSPISARMTPPSRTSTGNPAQPQRCRRLLQARSFSLRNVETSSGPSRTSIRPCVSIQRTPSR